MTDDLMSPQEVAERAGVSDPTVRRLVRKGILPRVAGLGVMRIPREAVERWLRGDYDAPDGHPRLGERARTGMGCGDGPGSTNG